LHHRSLGSEKEAKEYIRKIRHETLRISVIQRLEDYLDLNKDQRIPSPPPMMTGPESDSDDDDERSVPPPEPEIGMWVDQCKHLFLCYYDIYMVLSCAGGD
jgi:ubiquitin-conjugating enzyme E2 Z